MGVEGEQQGRFWPSPWAVLMFHCTAPPPPLTLTRPGVAVPCHHTRLLLLLQPCDEVRLGEPVPCGEEARDVGVSPCGRSSSGSESWKGGRLMQEKQSF